MEKMYQTLPPIDSSQAPASVLNRCYALARKLWSSLGRFETALNALAQEAIPAFIFKEGPFTALEISWLKRTPQIADGQCLLLLLSSRDLSAIEIFTIPISETPPEEVKEQGRLTAGTNLLLIHKPTQ